MRTGIALGSNMGDRLENLRKGRATILSLPGVAAPERVSRIYETEPAEMAADAGAFLNAVVEVEYTGQPFSLLEELRQIEGAMGRKSKRPRNASRTIDLDILYVGNLVLNNGEIVIPHPRLHLRRFVLAPLGEIRPELVLPGQEQSISEMLAALGAKPSVMLYGAQWERERADQPERGQTAARE